MTGKWRMWDFPSLPFRELASNERDVFSCFFWKKCLPQNNLNRCFPVENGKKVEKWKMLLKVKIFY